MSSGLGSENSVCSGKASILREVECRCEGACVEERTKNVMVRGVDLAGSGTVTAVEKRGTGAASGVQTRSKGNRCLGPWGDTYYVLTMSHPFPNIRILPATVQKISVIQMRLRLINVL